MNRRPPCLHLVGIRAHGHTHHSGHGSKRVLEISGKARSSRIPDIIHGEGLNVVVVKEDGRPGVETHKVGQLPVPFRGRYFNFLNHGFPERILLAGNSVLYRVDMLLGKIGPSGKEGICGRREKHLTLKRLRDAIQRIPGKAEVRGAKARGGKLGKLPCGGIIAVKGICPVKVRCPLQAPVCAVKIYKLLNGGLQLCAERAVKAYFINAVSAFGNA